MLVFVFFLSETCETLPNVIGGGYIITTDGATTLADYNCHMGYTMQGDITLLTCREDGKWDYEPPACGKYIMNFMKKIVFNSLLCFFFHYTLLSLIFQTILCKRYIKATVTFLNQRHTICCNSLEIFKAMQCW